MTIAEILTEVSSRQDRMWTIIQLNITVSFAFIAAAHFGAPRVRWFVTYALLVFYSCFTWYAGGVQGQSISSIYALVNLLRSHMETGESTAATAIFITEYLASWESLAPIWAMLIATNGLTLFVIIYALYQTHRKRDSSTSKLIDDPE